MKIFLNISFSPETRGIVWTAKNGATRRELVLAIENVENLRVLEALGGMEIDGCSVRYVNLEHQSVILIGADDGRNETVGIFLNKEYGYDCISPGSEIYAASSVGGPGNSESKFGIYALWAVLRVHTYKRRTPCSYWYLSGSGWVNLGDEAKVITSSDGTTRHIQYLLGIRFHSI